MGRRPPRPVPVEKQLRTVRLTMIFQAVLSMAGAGLILYLLALAEDNGDDTTGFGALRVLSVLSIVFAVLLFVCAVRLLHRLPWVRVTTLVIEGITVASGLIGLVSALSSGVAEPLSIVPIALGAAVIVPLLRRDVREWFAGLDGVAPESADRRTT